MADKMERSKEMERVLGYLENMDNLSPEDIQTIKSEVAQFTKEHLTAKDMETPVEWCAEGEYYYDIDGNKYMDFTAGGAVSTLGHANPAIMSAVEKIYKRLALHTHELVSVHKAYLSKALAELSPGDLTFTSYFNSVTEGNEMALKAARMATGGEWFISTTGGFHGDTFGCLSVMGRAEGKAPYYPMLQCVQFVEYGDIDEARKAVECLVEGGEAVAGIIVEPIQYEGGVKIPPAGYLKGLSDLCNEYGIALILDETATNMGRTGTFWRCEAEDVVPDILVFGRSFAGGILPMSGFVCKPWIWCDKFIEDPGFLGSGTFGGNPPTCVAALAAMKVAVDEDVAGQCKTKGAALKAAMEEVKAAHGDAIVDVRGEGLMVGVEFCCAEKAAEVQKKLLDQCKIMTKVGLNAPETLVLTPPYCVSDESINALKDGMNAVL